MLRKVASLLALALAVAVAPIPAFARTLDEIIKSGVIRAGVNPTLSPLGKFNEKNEVVGFDVDYATEIAKKLGVKLEVVQTGSPDRIPFVATGKIDFVMGAMTRNSERAKVIDFTVPIHTEVFGVLTTEAKPYKDWKELDSPNVTLVQVRGSTPVKFIAENLKQAKVVLLDNYPDVVRALAQGRGDAIVDAVDFLGEQMMNYKDTKWKVVPTAIDVDYDCIGVAKNSTGLRDWLNIAAYELQRGGKTDAMWQKWFGMKMNHSVGEQPYF